MSAVLPSRDAIAVRSSRLRDVGGALLCGLIVLVALALTDPICNSPFNDDWSYSFTVRKLLETGHLTYNGWSSASLIAQVYWGWLWVKLFGFSYTVLRLSTIPLAIGAVCICYLLARRAGLNRPLATFATLSLGLSPLYLPVAGSFMTDAPGLFFILLSMYALARAMEAAADSSAIGWIVFGAVVGLVGGTGRQIVWLVPFIMLPYIAWVRRDRLRIGVCAIIACGVVLGVALWTVHWFNRQPYSIPEISVGAELKRAIQQPAHYFKNVMALPLTMIWVILPSLWRVVTRGWTPQRAIIALLIFIGPIMFLAMCRPKYARAPWMGNTLSATGIMGNAELAGTRPTVLPDVVRILIAIVVFSLAAIILADVVLWLARPIRAFKFLRRFFLDPPRTAALLPVMIMFALVYVVLLLPRSANNMTYDRYLLPLMPCVLFPLFIYYQKQGDRRPPVDAWLLLSIFALFGIFITQEVTALSRARAEAANILMAHNIPRQQIDAGFEFDYETQIQKVGYLNDVRIVNPPNACIKSLGPSWIVQPRYRLEFAPAPDTEPTEYGTVDFYTYLYPFHRKVWIDEFRDPWWLDKKRAATRPSDSRHRFIHLPDASDEENR